MRGGNDTVTGGADADTFQFIGSNIGNNVITDFSPTTAGQNDFLIFDGDLLGANDDLNLEEILDQFTSVRGGNVVFDFGGGNSVTLDGVGSVDGLLFDDIDAYAFAFV